MPILLGVLASLLLGISDTLGRVGARRANATSHVSTAMSIGVVVAAVAAVALGNTLEWADLLSGAASGVLVALALTLMYNGMSRSSAAVVSPLAAVSAACIPLGWDVLGGARPSMVAVAGVGLAIGSLGLTTFNPNLGTGVRAGVLFGLAAGLFFGAGIILVADTAATSGAWPASAQRLSGFVAVAVLARRQGHPILLPSGLRHLGLLSGLAGTLGMVSLVIGAQTGELGVVSVAGSLFPGVVAVLATLFDDDEIRWWQGCGIALSIVGVALMALGQ